MNSEDNFAPIAALDLDPIKVKLMHQESGEGWSREYVDAVEFEYRRFLYLMKKFPNEEVAPLFDVDVFWHYHILDTMKYAVDCEHIFGYFLHHFPYSGMRGEDDELARIHSGARMQKLYEATFGIPYLRQQQGQPVTGEPHPSAPETAWSSPAMAKTAWSSPATARTAWSSPAMALSAWSSPATPKTAWSSPAMETTAWSSPATVATEHPRQAIRTTTVPNAYARPVLAAVAANG